MPPGRLQRLAGLEYLGEARYFVTMCCRERQPLFREATSVTAVRTQLLRTADSYRFVDPDGLWQHGYYERILRRDEASVLVCHYILNNPVRAGLVADPADYPFGWSCL